MSRSKLMGPGWGAQLGRQVILMSVSLVTLYPVLWVLKMALTPSASITSGLSPIPETVSLENFRAVISATDSAGDPVFWRQVWNSTVVAVSTTLLGIALSTTAAYGFSRFTFPGKDAGMKAFLITQMFPGVVMAIPLYLLLDSLHLLDSMLGLTLVYSTTNVPFCVWMLKGYFDTVPKELEEAALVDGASQWTIFTRIVLPLARPAIVVTALFSFMTAWNEYILAATFLSDERSATLPVVLQRYAGSFSTDWGLFAAGAILISLPVMLLFFLLQKHLVGGLTAGGIKG
ncbi:MAG: arabinogalactan oligomer/maltooligosaccharide transport system permease protein [Bradymonadia bacterium]|jgi:arabinogalactan oligomer/maltooligosaccharide transport system permease protein